MGELMWLCMVCKYYICDRSEAGATLVTGSSHYSKLTCAIVITLVS